MKKTLIGTLIICILHSILIFNQPLGINVILLTVPLLLFLVWMMSENRVIKNKYGLLFIIPILVLSLTFFIYDNTLKYLNILVIPVLYILMFIFTIKPMRSLGDTIVEFLNILVKPLNFMGKFTKETNALVIPKKTSKKEKEKKDYKLLKSMIVVVPILLIVLSLLASADSIFANLFHINIHLDFLHIDTLIGRIIRFVLLFFYLGATIFFITKEYLQEKRAKGQVKEHDNYTLNVLFIVLNILYLVFDIIQINSLMLHRVATGFNYAEYARSGFFQLMFITFINISIVLFSKKCKEETKTKVMSIIMIVLTYIIIASSFYRMFLYEQAYGYTILRLGVYAILITESILLIPTIVYIMNKKINILNYYMIISIIIYTFINCFSVDRIIAENNIRRYERTEKIDLYYLQNGNYDNLNQLRGLLKEIEKDPKIDQEDKDNLRIYIGHKDKRNDKSLFGYNLSKEEARKETTWKE